MLFQMKVIIEVLDSTDVFSPVEFKYSHKKNESTFNKNVTLTSNDIRIQSSAIKYENNHDFIEFSGKSLNFRTILTFLAPGLKPMKFLGNN